MEYTKAPPPPYSEHPQPAPSYSSQPPPAGFRVPPKEVVNEVGVVRVAPVQFGPEAQRCMCPHCHAHIVSTIKAEPNSKTHLFALLLLCLFWPCMCLPYCVDTCQAQNHYCPNCGAFLGSYDS